MDIDLHDCGFLFVLCLACLWEGVTSGHRACLLSNYERHGDWSQMYRRKSDNTTKSTKPPKFKLPHFGPQITAEYDPSYGYEPYWVFGDWVFDKRPGMKGDVCGEHCSPFYKQYGKVCGVRRDKENNVMHKTFDDYCKLLAEDCEGLYSWAVAYRGECLPEIKTFPTVAINIQPRVPAYLTALSSRWPLSKKTKPTKTKKSTTTKTKK